MPEALAHFCNREKMVLLVMGVCRAGTQAVADGSEVFLGLLLALVYLPPWGDLSS